MFLVGLNETLLRTERLASWAAKRPFVVAWRRCPRLMTFLRKLWSRPTNLVVTEVTEVGMVNPEVKYSF